MERHNKPLDGVRRPFLLLGPVLVPILLFTVVASAGVEEKAQGQGGACRSVLESDVILSDAQCQALQYFFATFVGQPITRIARNTELDLARYRHMLRFRVNECSVEMFPDGPMINSFSGFVLKRIEIDPTMTKEKAFAQALSVIKYCNGPTDLSEYTSNSNNGLWVFRHQYDYKGVPYIGPTLTIYISEKSGKLVALDNLPPLLPKAKPAKVISRREAVKAAIKWKEAVKQTNNCDDPNFSRSQVQFPYFASWYTKEVLAWPNDRGDLTNFVPNESHYCWCVPCTIPGMYDGVVNWSVFVDMETGQVVRF